MIANSAFSNIIIKYKKYFFMVFSCVIFNSLLLVLLPIFESYHPNASISNFGDSFWYLLVTIASVGYGDKFPLTLYGKFVGGFFVLQSIAFLSIIISHVSNFLSIIKGKKRMGHYGTHFSNHIVIIGWNSFANLITRELVDADKKVAIITENKHDIDIIYEEYSPESVFVFFGSLTNHHQFSKANISGSSLIFVNLATDTEKLVTILNLKQNHDDQIEEIKSKDKSAKIVPQLNFLVALEESHLKKTFRSAGVSYVLSKNEIASKLTASYIFEPDVANFASDLLDSAKKDSDCDIQEYRIKHKSLFIDKTFKFCFDYLKSEYKAVLIGIARTIGEVRHIEKLPDDNFIVNENDYFIIIVKGEGAKAIRRDFDVEQGVLQ